MHSPRSSDACTCALTSVGITCLPWTWRQLQKSFPLSWWVYYKIKPIISVFFASWKQICERRVTPLGLNIRWSFEFLNHRKRRFPRWLFYLSNALMKLHSNYNSELNTWYHFSYFVLKQRLKKLPIWICASGVSCSKVNGCTQTRALLKDSEYE